jgi:hypothetical protein
MSDITIPEDIIGDPIYDSQEKTLTFYGTAANEIAQILNQARERKERTRRAVDVAKLVNKTAKGNLLARSELHNFAQQVLDIYEVDR